MVKPQKRIDAHVHYALPLEAEELAAFLNKTATDMANLVLVPHTRKLSCVPEALMAKYKYPDRFFLFTSLDASNYYLHPKTLGAHQVRYIRRMRRLGCDGVKLIEGRPFMRRILPFPDFDDPAWEAFWAYAEKDQVPILWHVNDPQEYWNPEQATQYHKARGDTYDETDVHYEAQYAQVQTVLRRHPSLKIIFAHFYFMSAQLQRLGTLLDTFPNIMVDVTPGSEMYRILSENHEEAQLFFEKYQDRIVYGTDIAARCIMAGHMEPFDEQENLRRSELIDKLFTPGLDEIHQPDGVYLIDVPPFRIRGLSLSREVIDKIYGGNFLRFVGGAPAKVEPKGVIRECRRLRLLLKVMALFSKKLNPDPTDHQRVEAFFKEVLQR